MSLRSCRPWARWMGSDSGLEHLIREDFQEERPKCPPVHRQKVLLKIIEGGDWLEPAVMSPRPCSTAAVHLQLHEAEQWCSMGRTGCCWGGGVRWRWRQSLSSLSPKRGKCTQNEELRAQESFGTRWSLHVARSGSLFMIQHHTGLRGRIEKKQESEGGGVQHHIDICSSPQKNGRW